MLNDYDQVIVVCIPIFDSDVLFVCQWNNNSDVRFRIRCDYIICSQAFHGTKLGSSTHTIVCSYEKLSRIAWDDHQNHWNINEL